MLPHTAQLPRAALSSVPNSALRGYGPTIAACCVALAISLLAMPVYVDDSIAALAFVAAVGLAGWYGGLVPALLASVLGTVATDYFFETPQATLQITSSDTVLDFLSFVVIAVLVGKLKARLRTSDTRLKAVQDSRDELVEAVSHELRTPLTAIKTSIYSLRDRAPFLPSESRDSLLSTIEVQTDRLARFVDGAAALRRLEDGVEPHPELGDPAEVASAVLDRYARRLGDRPISFKVDEALPLVRIDPLLLDEAISALLDNVLVHTPPGTPVLIEVGVTARDLRISVSDAGPGVPITARAWIFEKYRRGSEYTAGLGVGLTIARAAAQAQGGRVWVEDSALGGARFVLVLPNVADTLAAA